MNALEPKKQEGKDNRLAVYNFFDENKYATLTACSKVLGLSVHAVGRHKTAIDAGWKPAGSE